MAQQVSEVEFPIIHALQVHSGNELFSTGLLLSLGIHKKQMTNVLYYDLKMEHFHPHFHY